jgi:hypothetical protein
MLELNLGPNLSHSPVLDGLRTSPSLLRALHEAGSSQTRNKWAPSVCRVFPTNIDRNPATPQGTRPKGTLERRRLGADGMADLEGTRLEAPLERFCGPDVFEPTGHVPRLDGADWRSRPPLHL